MSNSRFAVLLYMLLSLVLTWPLALNFTTHVPGDGIDDPSLAWNLWWIKTRLIDQVNLDIFHVGWMFHPLEINLAFYTLTPLNGLLSIPLQTSLSLIVANNLIVLSSFVLGGLGAFLLTSELLNQLYNQIGKSTESSRKGSQELSIAKNDLTPSWKMAWPLTLTFLPKPFVLQPENRHFTFYAALISGLIYAFASSKLFYVSLGQFNIASSQWIPFCILYTLRIGQSTSLKAGWRNVLMAALFLALQAWAELTYATFLIIFIVITFCWRTIPSLWQSKSQQPQTDHPSPILTSALPFTALALLFLLSLSPFLWAMLPDLRQEGDFFTSGGGFSDIFSADLIGYLMPTRLHPLLGSWTETLPFSNDKGQHIYIGYVAMGLAIIGFLALIRIAKETESITKRVGLFWGFNTFFFWLLTLGPWVRWSSQELPIPGPFTLISLFPFFNGNRYPSRYSVMLTLCIAVLAGIGIYSLLVRRFLHRSIWVVSIVTALFIAEHISIPVPLSDFRVPSIYQTVAAQPDDFALLELPTGWRNGARAMGYTDDVLLMMQQWYQTVHGKRRLGGNTSRNPAYKFQYFTEGPLIGDLIGLMNAKQWYMESFFDTELPHIIEQNRRDASSTLRALGVKYVTVHVERATDELLNFVDNALPLKLIESWEGADWTGAPSTIRLYQVEEQPNLDSWQIELAKPMGKLYLAEGWSKLGAMDNTIRYATRQHATLLLAIPSAGGRLKLELFGPASHVDLYLNGQWLTKEKIGSTIEGQWADISIPPGFANRPVDRLQLHFSGHTVSAATILEPPIQNGWPIGDTGAVLPAHTSLVVKSAGDGVGKFAHIYLNGQDVALNQRGYNLVALDRQGQLKESVTFDTCACDPGQLNPLSASAAMAQWLLGWEDGTIITGAVADEASVHLGQEAVDALSKLGIASSVQSRFRWSHAFIAVVGAGPGTAVEQLHLIEPATVFVGVSVDAPEVNGGAGRLEFMDR